MINMKNFFTQKGDKALFYVIVVMMILSLLFIFSSTARLANLTKGGNNFYYLVRQFGFVVSGICLIYFFQRIDYRYYIKISNVLIVISVILLLYAKFAGANINGAGRWIKIPLIGITFQPSEFAKIAVIIYMSRLISFFQEEKECNIKVLWKAWPVYVVMIIIFFDNISTFVLIGVTCYIMLFMGRLSLKNMGKMTLLLFSLAAIFVGSLFLFPKDSLDKVGRLATARSRIEDFVSGGNDVDGYSFQSNRARMAVSGGGLMGRGPGKSIQRNFLPHPYSDFIFAIIVEEYGVFLGAFLIIMLYLTILYRIGVIVRKVNRVFPAILVLGLGVGILLQAMVHIFVSMGISPVTGQTLPLLSMGGTSLLFTCISFGIILSVSGTFLQEEEDEKNKEKENVSIVSKITKLEDYAR